MGKLQKESDHLQVTNSYPGRNYCTSPPLPTNLTQQEFHNQGQTCVPTPGPKGTGKTVDL